MSLTFAREPITDALWLEVMPLLALHWAETESFPDIPLDVDTEAYRMADEIGMVRCFTVRGAARVGNESVKVLGFSGGDVIVLGADGLKRAFPRNQVTIAPLVGYAVFFVRPNLHCQGSVQATQDVLWLATPLRGTGTGAQFIDWCDAELARDGVEIVFHHTKLARSFGRTLDQLGYKPIEAVYAKRVSA